MRTVLAIDQGTTSSRALVFDETLRVLASAQRELTQYFPAPGLVEHDAEEIWHSVETCAREALAEIDPRSVAAVGITNQRETIVLWERSSGRPLHRALVWQDRRTAADCRALSEAGAEPLIRAKTGLVIDPYFSASKLRWLLDRIPGARARAEAGELACGTVDSWLMWRLSGGREHLTDLSNAARTLLLDLATQDWDEELLALWTIPRALLPRVVGSAEALFTTRAFGLDCPVTGVAGDQQAALFGLQCFDAGDAKCTYGTGCFILVNAGEARPTPGPGLLATPAWRIDGRTTYALEGSVFMGGATVQWLRDQLGLLARAADVEALAASVPDSGGVVLVPAFTGLGAPHWDADARGLLIGLTRGTSKAHIARAALEAIALQVADVLEAMRPGFATPLKSLKVDGGAAQNDLLMRIQARLLGLTLERPPQLENTALGAAGLAGLGAGLWPDPSSLRSHWRDATRIAPDALALDATALAARWRVAVARAKGWARAVE
ncbi:MAG TPA: glycerol kinase GlpK [Gammaproteobacteria bacterium]|nr:glycerol kinase GlpK [Gammaproteobacteria bacterium]